MSHPSRLMLCTLVFLPVLLCAQITETVSGNISQNTTWSKDKTYLLQGLVYVKNGAVLTIEPGTLIKGDPTSKGTLIVTRGAKILADGKRSQPIVFTSNAINPAPGDWGGVVILGYAPTNAKTNGLSCLGIAEGGINTPFNDARFGSGDQPGGCGRKDDNSGILRFVRIEYGGIAFQLNDETNGLTLAGVGNGTTIDYVEVAHSGDDGFEFFGGTVNCKHLIAYGSKDDDFDFDLGYQGRIQFAYSLRDPALSDVSGSNGIEIDNDNSGTQTLPKTSPTLSNFTVTGPSGAMGDNFRRAAHLRRNAEPAIYNSLFVGNFPVGLFIDGISTIANTQNNLLEIKHTYFADSPELLKSNDANFNINQWFSTVNFNNTPLVNSVPLALQNPFNYSAPNPQPSSVSPVNTAASFTMLRANIPYFEKVSYVGAFSSAEDWSCGWAKFENLNTNCTVETSNFPSNLGTVNVSPTIAGEYLNFATQFPDDCLLIIELYGMDGQYRGQLIREQVSSGLQTRQLYIGNQLAGLYLLHIQAGADRQVVKIIHY